MTIFSDLKADLTDDELAACMAAVAACLEKNIQAAETSKPESFNCWQAHGLLKLTGRYSKLLVPGNRFNLWKRIMLPAVLLGLFSNFMFDWLPVNAASVALPHLPVIVRVAVVLNSNQLSLSLPDGAQVVNVSDGASVGNLPACSNWLVAAKPETLTFQSIVANDQAQAQAVRYTTQNTPQSSFNLPLPAKMLSVLKNTSSSLTWFQDELDGMIKVAKLEEQEKANLAIPYSLKPIIGAGWVLTTSQPSDVIGVNGKFYRGAIWLKPAPVSQVSAINVLDLEDYLLSVVPSEMPSHWPLEALKAQAIAARSYAVANLKVDNLEGYDLKSTTEDQVYSGVDVENDATNLAVAGTSGVVLKCNGKVIPAFFHSTSGGYTELAENVWGMSFPFLKSVPDYDDESPYFVWSKHLPVTELEQQLTKTGQDLGQVLGIFVLSRGQSSRTKHLLIAGSNGEQVLTGEEFRRLAKLPSSNFNVSYLEDGYLIEGHGFGHGLGLSQWGAKNLAQKGYNAAQILTYYYKDVELGYL